MFSIFKSKKVFVIISHAEYEDGNKAARIEKILSSKKETEKKLIQLNGSVVTNMHPTMTTLKITKFYFDYIEYDLE